MNNRSPSTQPNSPVQSSTTVPSSTQPNSRTQSSAAVPSSTVAPSRANVALSSGATPSSTTAPHGSTTAQNRSTAPPPHQATPRHSTATSRHTIATPSNGTTSRHTTPPHSKPPHRHPVLSIVNLTQHYTPAHPVLKNLSLDVHTNEIVALVGESGCGKTTLIRTITGFESVHAGTITLNGTIVSTPTTCVPVEERNIGMVFQDNALFPHLTARQNIAFGLHAWSHAQRQHRITELLTTLKIDAIADRYPHQLSGGQIQRVAIARSIAPRPTMLLLDEPFNNLDVSLREEILPEIHALIKSEGISAICITHLPQEAFAIADKIAVLAHGTIQQCSTPKTIFRKPNNCHIANFFGLINTIPVRHADPNQLAIINTDIIIETKHLDPISPALNTKHRNIELLIRPDEIEVFFENQPCHRPDMLLLPGTITAIRYYGNYLSIAIKLTAISTTVHAHVSPTLHYRTHQRVQAAIPLPSARLVLCQQ